MWPPLARPSRVCAWPTAWNVTCAWWSLGIGGRRCSISLVPLVRCNRIIIVEAECLGVSTTDLVSKGSWVSYIEVTHLPVYMCVLIIYFKLNTRYVQDHLPRVLRNEMGPIRARPCHHSSTQTRIKCKLSYFVSSRWRTVVLGNNSDLCKIW